jgi:uncharacterized repeat protein (TIGR01451 family)
MRRYWLALISVISLAMLGIPAVPTGVGAAPAAAAPSITVSPGSAAAGASVRVNGSGFAGDCGVLVYWGSTDGLVLGGGKVAKDGTVDASVRLPDDASGAGSLVAVGRTHGKSGCAGNSGKSAQGAVELTGSASPYDFDVSLAKRLLRGNRGVDPAVADAAKGSAKGVHAIVQLNSLPRAGDLAELAAAGIKPLAYLNAQDGIGTAYLATIKPNFKSSSLVRAVSPLTTADKIAVGLAAKIGTGSVDTTVMFWRDVSAGDADALLKQQGISANRNSGHTVTAKLNSDQMLALAGSDSVQFLAATSRGDLLELDTSRREANVDSVQKFDATSGTYLGLSGLGVQISINDNGVDEHHNDFDGRLIGPAMHPVNTANPADDHGTHVASIAAGSGAMSNQNDDANNPNNGAAFQWRGMAPQAEIQALASATGDDAGIMCGAINGNGVDVSNHSYGYQVSGVYDAEQANIDDIIRGDAGCGARLEVFSAGNGGLAPQFGNQSGYFGLTKACKNCVMVANLADGPAANPANNPALFAGSSQGPTRDGRLKPELSANGTTVVAAGADVEGNPGNGYVTMSGTSMATPVVTGVSALLLQQYGEQFGVDIDTNGPMPSTLKAILVQTAQDLTGTATGGNNPDTGAASVYGAGPDWSTGYGLVDAQAASDLMRAEKFLEDDVSVTDVTDEFVASVVPGQAELKITLAWDDLPGTPNADISTPALVNDLDLLLVGPNGEVVRPLVLPTPGQFDCNTGTGGIQATGPQCAPNTGADAGPWPSAATPINAAPGTDRLNNLEQAVVANPAPGIWRVRVSVLNTDTTVRLPMPAPDDHQAYSLAGLGETRADLSITKTASPDPATAGEQLFYTVNVHNDGPDDAINATVLDVLPAGVTYVTTTATGGCAQAPAGTLTCSIGTVKAGQTKSFQIKVAVSPDLVSNAPAGPKTIFNTASVFSETVDDDTSDNTVTIGTIVEDNADLEVTKICKPDDLLPAGKTGHCTIFVDNHGPSYARSVTLTNVMLANGSFVVSNVTPSQGSCGAVTAISGGQRFVCSLGTLANASPSTEGRATVGYDFTATEAMDINDLATATSATPDPDTSNNAAQESVAVTAVTDLSITKTGPSSVTAGTTAQYDISITNSGPSTATGVKVEDNVPAGTELISVAASNGATCNAGVPGNALLPTVCSFGNLAPGASRTMTVVIRVLPGTRGPLNNDARVSSQTFDDDLSDNLATTGATAVGSADLSITKSDSPDPVVAGSQLTYTITVTNAGPSTADAVTVTDTLPAGTSFVSGVNGNGQSICALVQSATVKCDLGTIQPGTSATVYLTVLVAASVPSGTILSNTVSVSSSTPDPNTANNTAVETTSVITSAELWLDKQATQRSGNPSPIVTYTLVVHNNAGCETDAQSTPTPTCGGGGPSDAKNVVVVDTLPLDKKKLVVQFVSPQCTYSSTTHKVTCTAANVPAGATVTFVIEAQVQGSVGTILNTATLSSTTPDPVAANNTNAASLVMKGGTGKR